MTVVYLDSVSLFNALLDYLLFLSTARLAGIPLRRRRYLLCGVLGGLYAAAVFLPGAALLGHPLCRLAVGLAMALGAFRGSWRQAALFFLLAGGLAGVRPLHAAAAAGIRRPGPGVGAPGGGLGWGAAALLPDLSGPRGAGALLVRLPLHPGGRQRPVSGRLRLVPGAPAPLADDGL